MQHPSLSPTHIGRAVSPKAMVLEEKGAVGTAHVLERPAGNVPGAFPRVLIFLSEITEGQDGLGT